MKYIKRLLLLLLMVSLAIVAVPFIALFISVTECINVITDDKVWE